MVMKYKKSDVLHYNSYSFNLVKAPFDSLGSTESLNPTSIGINHLANRNKKALPKTPSSSFPNGKFLSGQLSSKKTCHGLLKSSAVFTVTRAASRFLSNLELRVTDLLKAIFFCHSFMILALRSVEF